MEHNMLKPDRLTDDKQIGSPDAGRVSLSLLCTLTRASIRDVMVEQKPVRRVLCRSANLLTGFLAGSMFVATALAQPGQVQGSTSAIQATGTSLEKKKNVSPFHTASLPIRAKEYYQSKWGVDDLLVRRTASGNLVRFSYRVTDPARAKGLGDRSATPYMYGQRSRALLHIPVMENIGQLRQTGIPDAGQEYWMVFSNKGDLINAGDRVNVIIGTFHADGLLVE
jgi:hypothetical protein